MPDIEIAPHVIYNVKRKNARHALRLRAFHGSTQSTSFRNADGKVIVITNTNPDGFLGFGENLIGSTLTIVTVAQGDIDDRGLERIRLEYFVDDGIQDNQELPINRYDKSEDSDPAPFLKFNIQFTDAQE